MATRPNPAIQALRDATRDLHDRLDADLHVVARLRSPMERPAMIQAYGRMLNGADTALRPWLPRPDAPPAPVLPPDPAIPALGGRAEALGFDYVIAGSALGGRVILRQLARDGVDTTDLGFLDPHGERTGAVWRGLLDTLERELAEPGALDQAIAGARKGFAFAEACLDLRP